MAKLSDPEVLLATSITGLFVVSMFALVARFVVTIFIREIPLRQNHHEAPVLRTEEEGRGVLET